MFLRKRGTAQIQRNAGRPKIQTINFLDSAYMNEEEEELKESHLSSGEDSNDWLKEPCKTENEDDRNLESLDSKRIRLAREYIKKVDEHSSSDDCSEEGQGYQQRRTVSNDNSKVADKLARSRLIRTGALEVMMASRVKRYIDSTQEHIVLNDNQNYIHEIPEVQAKAWQNHEVSGCHSSDAQHPIIYLKGHEATVTCVALQADGTVAYSGSKDNSVLCWDLEKECCKSTVVPKWNCPKDKDCKHHSHSSRAGEVLALAASDDGRYLAVGGRDALVKIFDVRLSPSNRNSSIGRCTAAATFRGHKGPITCLAFRSQSLQLFSGSEDRCIRIYSLDEMTYLDTLYGHQLAITGIDCYFKERPISIGRDRTARAWKVSEETHLIFRGGSKAFSADCISVIKDDWFLTGSEDGNIALWATDKKKAVATVHAAHGRKSPMITSIDALKGSDLAASGSSDGFIRFWQVRTGTAASEQGIDVCASIPVHGFVNGLAIGPRAKFCVAAVGQEPRLGRWERVARARNRVAIIRIQGTDEAPKEEVA